MSEDIKSKTVVEPTFNRHIKLNSKVMYIVHIKLAIVTTVNKLMKAVNKLTIMPQVQKALKKINI